MNFRPALAPTGASPGLGMARRAQRLQLRQRRMPWRFLHQDRGPQPPAPQRLQRLQQTAGHRPGRRQPLALSQLFGQGAKASNRWPATTTCGGSAKAPPASRANHSRSRRPARAEGTAATHPPGCVFICANNQRAACDNRGWVGAKKWRLRGMGWGGKVTGNGAAMYLELGPRPAEIRPHPAMPRIGRGRSDKPEAWQAL